MTNVTAAANPIVVDKSVANSGTTTITYEKDRDEEMWERLAGGSWTQVTNTDLFKRVATATAAEKGIFALGGSPLPPPLKPGMAYEVGIFTQQRGPLTTDPIRKAYAKVFCVWKKPTVRKLITDQNRDTGGTWHWHQIHTLVPTDVAIIGVSRKPMTIDSDGIPHLVSPDGAPTAPPATGTDHKVEINPLLPGHPYFFAAVVTDAFGNWEVVQETFTTKRRQLTVQFPAIHIYNDGDPNSYGEGEFWFRVFTGARNYPHVLEDFHLGTQDIDDWNESDRPVRRRLRAHRRSGGRRRARRKRGGELLGDRTRWHLRLGRRRGGRSISSAPGRPGPGNGQQQDIVDGLPDIHHRR